MSEPRRHHFVPQVYLKHFTCKDGKNHKIYVYDKIRDSSYKTDIAKVAVEKDFYRLINQVNENYWETYYSREVEPLYPKVVGKLELLCTMCNDKSIILDSHLKASLAKIIYSQLMRTQKARLNYEPIGREAARQRLEELKRELVDVVSPSQRDLINNFEVEDSFVREHTLKAVNDPVLFDRLEWYLENRYWVIYAIRNNKPMQLITSDHPVVLHNFTNNSTNFSDNGLGLDTTTILFPLTNKILVGLYPQRYFGGGLNKFDGRLTLVDEQKFINTINRIHYSQSYRQVYSSESIDLSTLRNDQDD